MLIEPVDDVGNLCRVMAGTAGYAVRLAGNPNQHSFNFEELQRGVVLLGLGHRRAIVLLAGQEHGGSLDVAHQRQGRATQVLLGVLPGRGVEPVAGEEVGLVGGQHEAVPVDDRLGGDRGAEAIGLADDPGGEDAAAAAARDEEIRGIDEAARQRSIDDAAGKMPCACLCRRNRLEKSICRCRFCRRPWSGPTRSRNG